MRKRERRWEEGSRVGGKGRRKNGERGKEGRERGRGHVALY